MQKPKKKERKEKGGKKATVMHSGLRQSGLQGQLYLTVVLENNKWCIHQLQKQGLFSGCRVCTRNDEQPSLLLFPSSERTTEFS